MKHTALTLLTALLLAPLAVLHAAGAPAKPNTVFILSDDQGASDCGFMSHPHIQRLHLDRLAARGMRFWESCCTHPLCCPSRGSPLISRMPHEWGS